MSVVAVSTAKRRRPRTAATAMVFVGGAAAAAALLSSSSCASAFAPPAPAPLSLPSANPRVAASPAATTTAARGRSPCRKTRVDLGMMSSGSLRDYGSEGGGPAAPLTSAPLTVEEERTLLSRAAEYRRIKDIEREVALRSPQSKNTFAAALPSVRAREAGYGDDVESYEIALRTGQKARDELVTRNMGLVHFVVNDILGTNAKRRGGGGGGNRNGGGGGARKRLNSLSRDDLLQEGAIGLSRAVDKYDPERCNGARFSTYAVYWIRAAALRCIAERDDLVRVPEHVTAAVRRMTTAASQLGLELDDGALVGAIESTHAAIGVDLGKGRRRAWREAEAAKALAERAGLTDRQLTEAMRARRRRNAGGYTAYEPWMKGADVGGSGVTPSTTSMSSTAEEQMDAEEIKKTLSAFLKPKELEALSWRYGLIKEQGTQGGGGFRDYEAEALDDIFGSNGVLSKQPVKGQATRQRIPQGGKWGEAMSFAEVGSHMAVSAEYGRRLCKQALDKLKTAADDGRLQLRPEWLV